MALLHGFDTDHENVGDLLSGGTVDDLLDPFLHEVIVDVRHLAFERVDQIEKIDFELKRGQVLGVLGRTGSGKTTLARLVFRLENAPHYVERILRHGPVTFDSLLARGGCQA